MREGIAEHRDALDRSVGDAGATHILNNLPGGAPAGTTAVGAGSNRNQTIAGIVFRLWRSYGS
ncbi:hypothetical protein AB1484_17755 [Parafrankia sp. FMc6]|uniref:hypothetical protein n=1 Tax=Parafrankia soli TaxID=2599596 RepID=UPI0034D3EF67